MTGAQTASARSTAALMWSLCPWVQTTATTLQSPTASRMGLASWAASKTMTSLSSPTSQILFVNVAAAAVEFEGAAGDDPGDVLAHRITTERSTSPACILWNASSMSSSAIRSETKLSNGNRPCK